MRVSGLKIIILLTAFIGLIAPATAQVEPGDTNAFALDSLRNMQEVGPVSDSTNPDSVNQLSTDSVYATSVKGANSLLDYEVVYTAEDSMPSSLVTNVIELYNKAVVEYGSIKMEAGYIRIEFDKSEIYAKGLRDSTGKVVQKPIFTEGGKQYRADEMRYNFETQKARINKVITQEGEGFLHGERVKKTGDKVFYIEDGSFTTCSHEDPHFAIITPKAKVITGEKVVTQFAYIEVVDIPTPLMIPFGFFPTTSKRKSGIILPSYGNSQFRGYFLKDGGFYWAANDYFDLTLTGDIYTQGGFGARAATNYKVRYKYSGQLNVNYDLIKFGREEFSPFVPGAFSNQSNFAVSWNHRQDPKSNPTFRFSSNVNIASTQFYKFTSVNPNEVLQNRLNSSINMSKSWAGKPYNLSMTLNHSQNNQTQDLTLTLPQVNFSVNRFFPFRSQASVGKKKWYEEIGISYTANAKNEIRTRMDKPLFTETVFRDSSRMGIQHSIPIAANYKLFNFVVFNPSMNYTERWYPNKVAWSYDTAQNRAVISDTLRGFFANRDFGVNASLSTKLYGLWRYNGFLQAFRHVMTPTVGFSYRPDFSDELWGFYDRIENPETGETVVVNPFQNSAYGSPSAGRVGALNFSVLNTFEAKVRDKEDSTGLKKVQILERLSLNASYNMAAPQYKWSNPTLAASSSLLDNLVRMNYNATFDLYGYDDAEGMRVPQFAWDVNNTPFRVTSQRFTMGLNLSANRFKKKDDKDKNEAGTRDDEVFDDELNTNTDNSPRQLGVTEGDIDYYRTRQYVDFDVPWSFNINYNLSSSSPGGGEPRVSQALAFSGDITLTEGWKIGFSSGYDFEAKDLIVTTFDFYRDLHCWELRATWVPVGFQQTYVITIRVKASMLSDLKLERRRGFGDFRP